MIDAETLKDLLAHLSPDEKRKCVDELASLEISQKNAEEVYRILRIFETGLDVNLAIKVREVCRKLETECPGKFSFDFLTSTPVIQHLRRPSTVTVQDLALPGEVTESCPSCGEAILTGKRKPDSCNTTLEKDACGRCGRNSYETLFCVWCGALMHDSNWQRTSTTRRSLALFIDFSLIATGLATGYLLLPEAGLLLLAINMVLQLSLFNSGTTLGKKVVGLQIIRTTDAQLASFPQILFRETIGKLVSLAIIGLGFFWSLFDENGQTWHDILSNSLVVIPKK